MPTFLGYEILDLDVLNIDRVRSPRSILRAQFGDGYADTAIVGMPGGTKQFALSAGVWPDDEDIRTIESVSAFEYYYAFFNARLDAGNEPFIITWREKYWLVDLAEPDIALEVLTADLFVPDQITMNQRRVSGVATNADGSLYNPPPSVPEGLTATPIDEYSILLEWEAST